MLERRGGINIFYLAKYKIFLLRKLICLYYYFISNQEADVKQILEYCSKNIEYYYSKGTNIKRYEFIDKKTVRDNYNLFIKRGFYLKNTGHTSGTTGTPGRYLRDVRSIAMEQIFQSRYFGWQGKYLVVLRGEILFKPEEKPVEIFKEVPFIKEMYVSSYHLNDESMGILVKRLQRIKNKCLWAYPSSAYTLADYCIRKKVNLDFQVVATSSEKLLDHQVSVIEKAFRCRVKDWYGQGERVASLYRCEYGCYHEVPQYSYIEYLHVKDNLYEIVGTTLYNKAMPLVRFKIGDLVEISDKPCPCGSSGKNITVIHGRASDFISLPSGRTTGSVLNVPFKKVKNIIEAQIIQKKDKSIIIKVVRNEFFSKQDERILHKEVFSVLPRESSVINYVDKIEKGSNGKFRFVINEGE